MPVMQWSDELKTGVSGVDCQHKALIRMLSGLYAITEKSQDTEIITEAASMLADFVAEHFQCEEKTMSDHDYPAYESHKKQHDEFAVRVAATEKQFNETGDCASLAKSIRDYMVPWLTEHFTKTDQEMADFFAGKPSGKVA